MAEGKKVLLTIEGAQFLPEDPAQPVPEGREDSASAGSNAPAVTRMQVKAEYYRQGSSHYLFYEEQPEGYPEPMKARLKFREDYLELTRQGALGCRMVYEAGKVHRTEYATPYGALLLDVETDSVSLKAGEPLQECPEVTVEYRLKNEGQLIGIYQLHLNARSI